MNFFNGALTSILLYTPIEWRYTKTSGAWGPASSYYENKHPEPAKLFSGGLSSVQLLPNDNILILSGSSGYAFELTPKNEIVWEYIVPLKNGNQVNQGSTISINDNTTFRMYRYPNDFEAFVIGNGRGGGESILFDKDGKKFSYFGLQFTKI